MATQQEKLLFEHDSFSAQEFYPLTLGALTLAFYSNGTYAINRFIILIRSSSNLGSKGPKSLTNLEAKLSASRRL